MFQLQSQYIGVDGYKDSLRFAVLRKAYKKWVICSLKEVANNDALHSYYSQFKETALVSAMQTRDVLMRPCEIALKKQKDIFAALDFHVEPLLPYALEKAIIQSHMIDQQNNHSQLTVYAVRKDHLTTHLETLKNSNLEPEIVTTKPHALAAFSQFLPQTGFPSLIIHEGEDEISFVLVEKQQPLIFRSIDAKKDLASEIQKTLLNFASSLKSKTYDSIYFLGKNSELKMLLQKLSGKPILSPSSPILSLTQEDLIQYCLAIGTATADAKVNFRQKEFSYPKPLKRLRKPLAAYFILTVTLACIICFLGERCVGQKKQNVEDAYTALLKSEKINPTCTFLKEPNDYAVQLHSIENQLKAKPESFPLFPQVPKVKETLSWLTSLSNSHENGGLPIVLESLHYQLIKHPDFQQKKEKYRVRVDLEFSAKDSLAAKTFQEALKNAHAFIDTSEEIQWLPSKGKYKTSFFLNDKTKYN